MTPIHPSLEQCSLFKGISPDDLPSLLQCLHATTKTYPEGSYIIHLGDEISQIGIVLRGRLELLKENASGNHTLITFLSPSQLFGEGIVCTSKRQSPVAVRAYEESEVLFFSYAHMIRSCGNACNFHTQLIHNMLLILGEKNYLLNTKMDFLLLKGIQEKLITYLLKVSKKQQSLSFDIPLNRTELAAFLNVSRTSMCRELSLLQKEGLLDYYQNSFKLLDIEKLRHKLLL